MTQGAGHRVPLAGTTWSVWRDVCVRSAGFPADMLLAICDEPLAPQRPDGLTADADPAGRVAYDKEYRRGGRAAGAGHRGCLR